MAFRKKAELLLPYEPDIMIIPECENPERLKFPATIPNPTSIIWHGENLNKGLGIFSNGDYKLNILPVHEPAFKTIIPIKITGPVNFTLFAIWANNPDDNPNQYVGQTWKAIHHYEKLIRPKRTILAGDFNSNTIWDKPRRVGNHSALVDVLAAKKISSVYHHYFGHAHGKEKHATFNLYKNISKPYHLDYCFASQDMLSKLKAFEVGNYADWKTHSDHLPLIIEFDI